MWVTSVRLASFSLACASSSRSTEMKVAPVSKFAGLRDSPTISHPPSASSAWMMLRPIMPRPPTTTALPFAIP